MSDSQESLSPTISSQFTTFTEAKTSLEECLGNYQPLDRNDDTLKLLKATFTYLPQAGQIQLADDVAGCLDDTALRQLADSIDTGLLRPMLSKGGRTPYITPSPRVGLGDSIENLDAEYIESATRDEQPKLRDNCLKRDGNKCVLSGCWDTEYPHRMVEEDDAPVEAAHIIPFGLGRFNTDDDRQLISRIWVNIFRYFPGLRARLNLSLGDVNRVDNMMTLLAILHTEFGRFHFVLEETQVTHQYRVKKFPRFPRFYANFLPQMVTFVSHNSSYNLPSPEFIAVHTTIGNILHASGRAETIEKFIRDLGENSKMLARDGTTDIGNLLSVSKLSVLASASNST